MQPSPMADTSRLFFPSLRLCIASPTLRNSVCLTGTASLSIVSWTWGLLPISMKFLPDSPKFAREVIYSGCRLREHTAEVDSGSAICAGWRQLESAALVLGEYLP